MEDEQTYVVDTIHAFLKGTGKNWDWDDFENTPLQDERLNSIRLRATALDLPLDLPGKAELLALLEEAEQFTNVDFEKSKPWRMAMGAAIGFLIGALIWWANFIPAAGFCQNPHLLLTPAALGIVIVSIRNRRKGVGPYDPDIAAMNMRGRV